MDDHLDRAMKAADAMQRLLGPNGDSTNDLERLTVLAQVASTNALVSIARSLDLMVSRPT